MMTRGRRAYILKATQSAGFVVKILWKSDVRTSFENGQQHVMAINALCVKSDVLRKSKIIKSKKYKNTVRPMFVHEMTKKIAKNVKGWSADLEILCA